MALSYSAIKTYKECPSKFFRKYIAKEEAGPRPTREEAPQMYRGTDIHDSIEAVLKGEANKVHEEAQFYNDFVMGLRTMGAMPEVPFAYTEDWEEVEFDDPTAAIRGFIDAVLIRDNLEEKKVGISYEWKSGKRYDEHSMQRNLYGLATLLKFPEIDEAHVITTYIDLKENVPIVYPRDMLTSYKWMWTRHINATKPPQPYPMRPSWKCKNCPYSRYRGGKCPN